MSHFTTIKTEIRHKESLVKALELLQYTVEENKNLKVSGPHVPCLNKQWLTS